MPNNISVAGAQAILRGAFQGVAPALYIGLVVGTPDPAMIESQMTEPTIGHNGYARQLMAINNTVWPTVGASGNEAWIQSEWMTFAPTGAWDQAIQRVALFGESANTPGNPVFCLSAPLPAAVVLDQTTVLANRQFKYTIFL